VRRLEIFDNVLTKVRNVGDNSILKKGVAVVWKACLDEVERVRELIYSLLLCPLQHTFCYLVLILEEFSVCAPM
jgi:hypothetical protein